MPIKFRLIIIELHVTVCLNRQQESVLLAPHDNKEERNVFPSLRLSIKIDSSAHVLIVTGHGLEEQK